MKLEGKHPHSLPYAMSRATFDVLHPQITGPWSNRNAIVSGPDGATGDADTS